MSNAILINYPFEYAIFAIQAAFNLVKPRSSDSDAARAFGWYLKCLGVASIVID